MLTGSRRVIEDEFAQRLAKAIAADAVEHPARGPLRRAVVSWFEQDQPLYLILHLRGDGDADDLLADPWDPARWEGTDADIERGHRVTDAAELQEPAATLVPIYAQEVDAMVDAAEAGVPEPDQPSDGLSRAHWETVRLLPQALRDAEVPLAPDFAVTALHFQRVGGLDVFRDTAPPELFALYESRGELPPA